MTYIVVLNAYELHLGDEKTFNDFMKKLPGFYIIHMIGIHYFSILYLYTYVDDYIVSLDFTTKKYGYRGV